MYTNVLKGGKTDASLEYFNMKDYFKVEKITEYYIINKHYIQNCLNINILENNYKNMINEVDKGIANSPKLL